MGISRDSRHKKRLTGGVRAIHQKKRKYELGRPAASTKIGPSRVRKVRVRGGNYKRRALRCEFGNFHWATQGCLRKCRIQNVVYHATSNELVRTNTLVKGAIVSIDATPFKQWHYQFYGKEVGAKETTAEIPADLFKEGTKPATKEKMIKAIQERRASYKIESLLEEQFTSGRVLACISTRPGQVGSADGYILEGKELEFYKKKVEKKKSKAAA